MVEDAEVHRVWEEGVQEEHLLHCLVHQPAHLELLSKGTQDHQVPSQWDQVAHLLELNLVPQEQVLPPEHQEDHLHQEVKDRLHREVKGHLHLEVRDHLEQAVLLDHLAKWVVQDPWHLSKDSPQEVLPEPFHLVQEDQDRQSLQVR